MRAKPTPPVGYIAPVACVAGPMGFVEGCILPWAGLRVLVKRPLTWLRLLIATVVGFLGGCMSVGVVGAALFFGNQSAPVQQAGQELLITFSFWLLFPCALAGAAAGWAPFLASKRIGWGVALESLRTHTGALLGLGFMGMIVGIGLAAAARFTLDYSVYGSFAITIIGSLVLQALLLLGGMRVWAGNARALAACKFALQRLWRICPAWLGTLVGAMGVGVLMLGGCLAILAIAQAIGLGPKAASAFLVLVVVPVGLILASWCLALHGFIALGLYHAADKARVEVAS